MTLGERIKSERNKKGISQAALGDILQITQQAVAKWEKNQSEPDTRALKEMANLFGISLDCLLGLEVVTNEGVQLSGEEQRLINVYRSLSDDTRATLWSLLGTWTPAQSLAPGKHKNKV